MRRPDPPEGQVAAHPMTSMPRLPAAVWPFRMAGTAEQDRAAMPSSSVATPTETYAELAPQGDVTDFGGGPVGVGAA